MATIKDVAAIAGVSFTTVSHVVNNSRPVSAEVRLKVERAILELDYVPSAVARSLKARNTLTIGLLVPNATNPYFAELARGWKTGVRRTAIACSSAIRTTILPSSAATCAYCRKTHRRAGDCVCRRRCGAGAKPGRFA